MIRKKLYSAIMEKSEELIEISHEIHENPELGDEEFFACEILSKKLSSEGFHIKNNICDRETAFIATKEMGEGPHIVFLAEYDALPEIGHGCGHNIIGSASVLAAIGLSKMEDSFTGKISVFGTPAEEGAGKGGAKADFIEAGYFKDVDAALMIHPANENYLSQKTLAVDIRKFEFFGKPSHAASNPEEGINALDAMILFFSGIGMLRQQVKNDCRIHGIITNGGEAPNIIPKYTSSKFFIRSKDREYLNKVTFKVEEILRGAAIATGCDYKITETEKPLHDFKTTIELDELFKKEGKELGIDFSLDKIGDLGSTDAGNVSHVVPTAHIYLKICDGVVPHTVEFANASKSDDGDKALINGAKLLSSVALRIANVIA